MDGFSVLQWNARGLRTHCGQFKQLIQEKTPSVICVQETCLKPQHKSPSVPGYDTIRQDRPNLNGGGLITYISNTLAYHRLQINHDFGPVEVVGTQIKLNTSYINILNIYVPPHETNQLQPALTQLAQLFPTDTVYLGDFNIHHPILGSTRMDKPGEKVIQWIDDQNLVILNDGSPTRIDPHTGNTSVLDVTIVPTTISTSSDWVVIQDPNGSDHLPVITTFSLTPYKETTTLPKSWVYTKANWSKFANLLSVVQVDHLADDNIDHYLEKINKIIHLAAQECIPRTSGKTVTRPINPAWTDKCTEARKASRKAFRDFQQGKITNQEYNRACKHTKHVILQEQQTHWQNFTATLNSHTKISSVWRKVKSLLGKNTKTTIPTLQNAHTSQDKADLIAKTFQQASSNTNLDPAHTLVRDRFHHRLQVKDTGPNTGTLNLPFTLHELKHALMDTKNTAPGGDKITYIMLKHLPPNFTNIILHFYNQLFTKNQFPTLWRNAIVIPIPKPNKDPHVPDSYRPISLTSHLCKTFEKMLNTRLRWYLDKQGKLDPAQSGFRPGRSTIDNLVQLETKVLTGMANKKYTGAVFIDISKAFDLVWHDGLIYKLRHMFHITGNALCFIRSFLSGRKIQVTVNQATSELHSLDNGTPQGSVISPTLFNLMINDLSTAIQHQKQPYQVADLSQFADDTEIHHTSGSIKVINNRLQSTLDSISKWSIQWGFKLSQPKTVAILFGRSSSQHTKNKSLLKLYLRNHPIKVETQATFLGVIFDEHMTFRAHIEKLQTKCTKLLNLMRCISGTKFGADKQTLLMFYKSLIRSSLDYGCQAYNSGCRTYLQRLDRIQQSALKIALRAHRSTEKSTVLLESGELPLNLRRLQLSLRYWVRISTNTKNPANKLLQLPYTHTYTGSKAKRLWEEGRRNGPFGYQIWQYKNTYGLPQPPAKCLLPMAPWILPPPTVCTNIGSAITKKHDNPIHIKSIALQHVDMHYQGFQRIYTDGSKEPSSGKTGAAIYDPSGPFEEGYRCTDNISVYSTEMIALIAALKHIHNKGYQRTVVLSDSLSALQTLQTYQTSRPDLLNTILTLLHKSTQRNQRIQFQWIPSHVGIRGNETVDNTAKQALSHNDLAYNIPLGVTEIYSIIHRNIHDMYKTQLSTNTKLIAKIKPNPCTKPLNYHSNIHYDKIITRLRVGKTNLLGDLGQYTRHTSNNCTHCQVPETITHYLLHCPQHDLHRSKLKQTLHTAGFTSFNLQTLLTITTSNINIIAPALIEFITSTGYSNNI